MAVFGYSKRVVNEHSLCELKEVTFDVPLSDLRRIATFLIACADQAESGEWQSSHLHLTGFDPRWDIDHPESDVIVLHPRDKSPH
jgi:hypothetical protein